MSSIKDIKKPKNFEQEDYCPSSGTHPHGYHIRVRCSSFVRRSSFVVHRSPFAFSPYILASCVGPPRAQSNIEAHSVSGAALIEDEKRNDAYNTVPKHHQMARRYGRAPNHLPASSDHAACSCQLRAGHHRFCQPNRSTFYPVGVRTAFPCSGVSGRRFRLAR